jgi:hypothetical protein
MIYAVVQDITDVTDLATRNDYTVAGVLAAVAVVAVLMGAWILKLYIAQRDKQEDRMEQMIPIMRDFVETTKDLKTLIHQWLASQGGP